MAKYNWIKSWRMAFEDLLLLSILVSQGLGMEVISFFVPKIVKVFRRGNKYRTTKESLMLLKMDVMWLLRISYSDISFPRPSYFVVHLLINKQDFCVSLWHVIFPEPSLLLSSNCCDCYVFMNIIPPPRPSYIAVLFLIHKIFTSNACTLLCLSSSVVILPLQWRYIFQMHISFLRSSAFLVIFLVRCVQISVMHIFFSLFTLCCPLT